MKSFKEKIYRIAITGPESSGKSTLARNLAEYYKTEWVPEFARKYIDQLNRPYNEHDLTEIAKGQISREEEIASKANKYLFCDTELTVIKIWSEYKYGNIDPYILSEFNNRLYDLNLLMDIDLPWKYDKQREHPENQKFFFDWFVRELKVKNANYHVISGSGEERFENACLVIEREMRRR